MMSKNSTVFHNKRFARALVPTLPTTVTSDNVIVRGNLRPPPYSISLIEKKGCHFDGGFYEIGQRIEKTSNPCQDCRCNPFGVMRCDPMVSVLLSISTFRD